MAEPKSDYVSTFTGQFASWTLLLSGIAIWAATMLVPAHLDVLKLEHKHDVMREQTEHMTAQRERYDQFRLAVDRREPAAVALLADKHLNLRPADRVALRISDEPALAELTDRAEIALVFYDGASQGNTHEDQIPGESASVFGVGSGGSASLDEWLYQPLPAVTYQPDVVAEANTRLGRWTTGPTRMILALAAGLLIFAGLMLR